MGVTRKSNPSSWIPLAWTVGSVVVGIIFSGGVLYATISGTLSRHDSAIVDLTRVLKDEALKREEVRKEYMGAMGKQTEIFLGMNEKLATLSADTRVQASRYETVTDRLNKLGEDVKDVLRQTQQPQQPGQGRR
jgi:hypothetical protein